MTVRELIAKLQALPEAQKDLDVAIPVLPIDIQNVLVTSVKVAPADYGQLMLFSTD